MREREKGREERHEDGKGRNNSKTASQWAHINSKIGMHISRKPCGVALGWGLGLADSHLWTTPPGLGLSPEFI